MLTSRLLVVWWWQRGWSLLEPRRKFGDDLRRDWDRDGEAARERAMWVAQGGGPSAQIAEWGETLKADLAAQLGVGLVVFCAVGGSPAAAALGAGIGAADALVTVPKSYF